jgi:hypothetical protein
LSPTRGLLSPADLRAEIARDEADIGLAFEAPRERVVLTFEGRQWVRRKPGLVIAGAFVLGFSLGCRGG